MRLEGERRFGGESQCSGAGARGEHEARGGESEAAQAESERE